MFWHQTFEVWQLLKQTVTPKVSCLLCFWPARSAHISLFLTLRHFISRSETAHLPPEIILLTSKNSCKEYFVEWKQIKSTTGAYSKLWMFGQNMSCLHAIIHFFFLTCTHLDATECKMAAKTSQSQLFCYGFYFYKAAVDANLILTCINMIIHVHMYSEGKIRTYQAMHAYFMNDAILLSLVPLVLVLQGVNNGELIL